MDPDFFDFIEKVFSNDILKLVFGLLEIANRNFVSYVFHKAFRLVLILERLAHPQLKTGLQAFAHKK